MRTFPERLIKKLPDGFIDNVLAMDTDDIKKKIILHEGNIFNIENDLETNEKIVSAKEELKEMISPYRETKASEMAAIKFCIFTMQERGMEIGNREEEK